MTRLEALRGYLGEARWFGGKGRDFDVTEVDVLPLDVHLVTIQYADGGTDVYQLPLSSYDRPNESLSHAFVGEWDDQFHYDAVHDHDSMAIWLERFAEAAKDSPLLLEPVEPDAAEADAASIAVHRVPGHDLDLDARSSLFSGEQSNSSVAFGEDSLLKVYRRVTPGVHPDVEIHQALTEAGSEHVAQLYGWMQSGETTLAMLQQFLRTSTEGWDFALTSVRNLFAEADLYPDEVGGDFAAEAHRLGVAVAEVHAVLRERFPTQPLDVAATAAGMNARLDAVVADVPALAEHAATARAAFDRLAALERGGLAQRIHGDLHLGQTLRSALGWKLVDFEGEPAKPLADRVLPDSPWRDVAGMLRSFDYAASTVQRDFDAEPAAADQLAYRGQEWVQRNRDAFLTGYAEATAPLTEADRIEIAAYELDKAVYEVGYEIRNRPAWVAIPLAALARAEVS